MPLDFTLTPEQEAMRESVRKFAERELSPGTIERDESGEFNHEDEPGVDAALGL